MSIFCIGRNYVAHAHELGNEVPTSPVIFMKPSTAVLAEGKNFTIPSAYGNLLKVLQRLRSISFSTLSQEKKIFFSAKLPEWKKIFFQSTDLHTGDVILLIAGGHGFFFYEPSELIEVKQGPFMGELDKVRFEGTVPR